MNWFSYWNSQSQVTDNLKSVQRTKNCTELTQEELRSTINFFLSNTLISGNSIVLDLCCGNGIVTKLISKKTLKIDGIDFSSNLIQSALTYNNNSNITYRVGNVLDIDNFIKLKYDVITIFFSFQYFSNNEGKLLISKMINHLKDNGKIFISDIPDKRKQHLFSGKGFQKLKYYIKYYLGIEQTGKFWSKNELNNICKALGVQGKVIIQPNYLPYSHYRFDYLITKN